MRQSSRGAGRAQVLHDPMQGTGHLRTPLQTGIDITQRLQGRLSGIALPKLIVDTPAGLGKVPVGVEDTS